LSSPDWIKTRLDLRPQSQGFAYLDQASLAPYIAATMSSAIPQDGTWQTSFTFASNVSSYVGSLRYRKNSHGQVELEGRWCYTTSGTSSTSNLFQLPAGYRPVSEVGLNVARAIPCWLTEGSRSANWFTGGTGLSNQYSIGSPVCWLRIDDDGWVSMATNVWGELLNANGNPDSGYNIAGSWRNWGNKPWDYLYGRIYNFRFPTD